MNIASLGIVIKFFLEEAEKYAKEAQSKAELLNLEGMEDLETEETPESVMLGRVSGEDTKDRTDRYYYYYQQISFFFLPFSFFFSQLFSLRWFVYLYLLRK